MESDTNDGASPRELLLEACRRNNTNLLSDLLAQLKTPERITPLLNTATDGVGNYCLHVAAAHGSYDILDHLLDQEGLEVDPINRLEGDTPLHTAIRYINELKADQWEPASQLAELLLDAGADPRIRNKAKLKPLELADPCNAELRLMLQKAEFALMAGADVVDDDDDDDDHGGPASDSD